jgi:multiple sugar transport system substrate-binding protein
MPWYVETRAIFYRRDLLQAAGIDESTAFATQADLEQTLERLQASGVAVPWVVPSRPTVNTFHNLTSWIWGAGGDYVDERHQRLTFTEEPARTGVRAYYGLHRFLPPEAHHLDILQADALFIEGKAAVTVTGPWLVFSPFIPRDSGLWENVGIALPPGIPCILGSHLVVWKYVPPRQERLALELVRFLTGKKAQMIGSQQVGMLPVHLDALSNPPFSDNPYYQTLVHGLHSGRVFPGMRLWGKIEEQITIAFSNLWVRILTTPNPDVDALITAELEPLVRRLNRVLGPDLHL